MAGSGGKYPNTFLNKQDNVFVALLRVILANLFGWIVIWVVRTGELPLGHADLVFAPTL